MELAIYTCGGVTVPTQTRAAMELVDFVLMDICQAFLGYFGWRSPLLEKGVVRS